MHRSQNELLIIDLGDGDVVAFANLKAFNEVSWRARPRCLSNCCRFIDAVRAGTGARRRLLQRAHRRWHCLQRRQRRFAAGRQVLGLLLSNQVAQVRLCCCVPPDPDTLGAARLTYRDRDSSIQQIGYRGGLNLDGSRGAQPAKQPPQAPQQQQQPQQPQQSSQHGDAARVPGAAAPTNEATSADGGGTSRGTLIVIAVAIATVLVAVYFIRRRLAARKVVRQ